MICNTTCGGVAYDLTVVVNAECMTSKATGERAQIQDAITLRKRELNSCSKNRYSTPKSRD